MVPAMNETIGPQAFPTLYSIDQVARRYELPAFTLRELSTEQR
jgi:hypothetical protein